MSSPASFLDTPTGSETPESIRHEDAKSSMGVQNDNVQLIDRPVTPSSSEPGIGGEPLRRAQLHVYQTPVHFQISAARPAPVFRATHRHLPGTRPPPVTPTPAPRTSSSYAYPFGSSDLLLGPSLAEDHLVCGSGGQTGRQPSSLTSIYPVEDFAGLGDDIGAAGADFGGGHFLPPNNLCAGSGSFVSSGVSQTQNQNQNVHSSFQNFSQPRLHNSSTSRHSFTMEFPTSQQLQSQQQSQHQFYHHHHGAPAPQSQVFQHKPCSNTGLLSSNMASLGVSWPLTGGPSSRAPPSSPSPPPPPPPSTSSSSFAALAAANNSALPLQEAQQQLKIQQLQLQNSLAPVLHQQQPQQHGPFINTPSSPNFILLPKLEATMGYGYFLDRGNGKLTRLIPADMLPPMKEIPASQEASVGMVILPSLQGPLPPGVPSMNQPIVMQTDNATKSAATHKKPKIYCDKWVHEGVCAFTQQGCRFKHEMPMDKETQFSLGLFHGLPMWWKRQESDAQRLRLAAGNNTESSSSASSSPTDVAPSSRSSANLSDRRPQTQTAPAHAASQWRSGPPGSQGPQRHGTSALAHRSNPTSRPAAGLSEAMHTGDSSKPANASRSGGSLIAITEALQASPLLSPVTLTRARSGHCDSRSSSDLEVSTSSAQPRSAFPFYIPRTSNTQNSGGDSTQNNNNSRSGNNSANSSCVWGPIAPPKPQSGR